MFPWLLEAEPPRQPPGPPRQHLPGPPLVHRPQPKEEWSAALRGADPEAIRRLAAVLGRKRAGDELESIVDNYLRDWPAAAAVKRQLRNSDVTLPALVAEMHRLVEGAPAYRPTAAARRPPAAAAPDALARGRAVPGAAWRAEGGEVGGGVAVGFGGGRARSGGGGSGGGGGVGGGGVVVGGGEVFADPSALSRQLQRLLRVCAAHARAAARGGPLRGGGGAARGLPPIGQFELKRLCREHVTLLPVQANGLVNAMLRNCARDPLGDVDPAEFVRMLGQQLAR